MVNTLVVLPETHQQGMISIHNQELIEQMDLTDADLGLQIAADGRIWLCVNGIAFIRFKPFKRGAPTEENLPPGVVSARAQRALGINR